VRAREVLRRHGPSAVGALAASVLLVGVFRKTNWTEVAELVGGTGPVLLVCLVPQLVGFASETVGWRELVAELGYRLRYLPMLRIRVATEALFKVLPAGVVWCESMKPVLLRRHTGLPVPTGVAAAAGRKYARLWSHCMYISLAFVLGLATLRRASRGVLGVAGLEWIVLATALVVLALAVAMALGLSRSAFAEKTHALAARLPLIGKRLAPVRGFAETDVELARVGALGGRALALPVLLCLVAWCAESAETWLVLRLLGVELSCAAALAIEVTVSFARQLFFVVPAGLGVQDAGYVGFLTALGVPNALEVGAAFALVKRGIEVGYSLLGLALLGGLGPRVAATAQPALEALHPRVTAPPRFRAAEPVRSQA
jgi:glycosyltransferase 2 family protein